MRLPQDAEKIKRYPYFAIDDKGCFPEATVFMLTGEHIDEICAFLCSEIGFYIFTRFYMGPVFDKTGFRYKKEYLLNLPIPKRLYSEEADYEELLSERLQLTREEFDYILSYKRDLLMHEIKKSSNG